MVSCQPAFWQSDMNIFRVFLMPNLQAFPYIPASWIDSYTEKKKQTLPHGTKLLQLLV